MGRRKQAQSFESRGSTLSHVEDAEGRRFGRSSGTGLERLIGEPTRAVQECVYAGMTLQEVAQDADVEPDRVPAARKLAARGEEDAVVGRSALGGLPREAVEVGPVLGHDRPLLCRHHLEELLVLKPLELGTLLHRYDVVAQFP